MSRYGTTAAVDNEWAVGPAAGAGTSDRQVPCVNDEAAPAIVNDPDRLLRPLRRAARRGAPDPG